MTLQDVITSYNILRIRKTLKKKHDWTLLTWYTHTKKFHKIFNFQVQWESLRQPVKSYCDYIYLGLKEL